ncbi:bifunctional tetrahydrofolate synthase/dihydrofolate synthase [Denitratisoma oestradiolicum]|uniref:Dihydrofolate synthase/folylpolyglutamate synthase n=1 Tax=Denitratisoma oestradiolicum TaxID=311182 RepID=A0A6S6XUT5_9PROT|nr:bifunctional tetrahydrofolate synthase/dihydrofolate synthase [Denitratisoma oestradiolicum]TWO81214.1 bifunctional tetrahydrofolate synthase/dihydrofolate synthase [Denitratisoma oestradiolicum]CAB1367913.1 bifunctional folylpolyglutamate synthase and dihydrofolate synthase [Denitratisoma oestradiolicum]
MLRTLEDWLTHIECQHGQTIALGLDRVRRVKETLGQTPICPVILVGGTNGKGSTCAMLERILLCAGYRVGLYTSPHLLRYNERVRVNGRSVVDESLCEAFIKVEAARGETPLTYFEFGTLAAWEVFSTADVEVVILEVGLGGRLDAVNIYEPDCAIVTTVDLDHMDYLGPTREHIGFEKAGIFRPGKVAICGDTPPPQTLLDHSAALGVDLQLIGRDFGYQRLEQQWQYWGRAGKRSGLAYPALRGGRQLSNASVALAGLDALHELLPVAMQDIRRGLAEVELTGRFQVLPGRPTIVLDVAHNPQAARVLAENLGDMAFHPETWGVFGMLRDKDISGVIGPLRGRITRWLPCSLDGPRAATAEGVAHALLAMGVQGPLPTFPSTAAALTYAQEHAGEGDRIVAFGSFLTVADALRALQRDAL